MFAVFELDNLQNEAILRDFFKFWSWQHQKQSNSARLPWKMKSKVQRWQPRTNAFCDFSTPPIYSTAPATKNWCQVMRSAAPVTQNHLSKPTDLMLQNATPLGKSAPWPPNISHDHVFCTAPATENASLQILFKCPTAAMVFGNETKPSRFAHFWQGAQSLAPATRNELWKSNSGPNVVCFVHFDFEMCFAPQRRALFRHLNLQKWREHVVSCAFWLRNVLRATTPCTFSTSQLAKVVRQWCVLYILTSKCASRHNGVHFFDISTSKSGPRLRFFCTFWLVNVLRATTACNFSSLIWPAGSAPAALASLLFDPPKPQIIGKTQCFATFLPFRASASSFFWLFLFSDLLSSNLSLLSASALLCFSSVHIVGSLTSKLPSIKYYIIYYSISYTLYHIYIYIILYPQKLMMIRIYHCKHSPQKYEIFPRSITFAPHWKSALWLWLPSRITASLLRDFMAMKMVMKMVDSSAAKMVSFSPQQVNWPTETGMSPKNGGLGWRSEIKYDLYNRDLTEY